MVEPNAVPAEESSQTRPIVLIYMFGVCLQVIAENLSEDEIAGLKEMFKMIDADNSGQITFEELKVGLKKVGANLQESEIYALMQAVSDPVLIFGFSKSQTDRTELRAEKRKKLLLLWLATHRRTWTTTARSTTASSSRRRCT